MGRKLLKTVQTITTFRNPLADPVGTRRGPPLVSGPQFENRCLRLLTRSMSRQLAKVAELCTLASCSEDDLLRFTAVKHQIVFNRLVWSKWISCYFKEPRGRVGGRYN